MTDALTSLTWTCHVCDDERPDALIAVAKGTARVGPRQIEVGVNVRYCNDSSRCWAGAQELVERFLAKLKALDNDRA